VKRIVLAVAVACSSCHSGGGGLPVAAGGAGDEGSAGRFDAMNADAGSSAAGDPGGGQPEASPPAPIPGADACHHPPVAAQCSGGFCRIPAGCYIKGSPATEFGHAARAENQAAVTLTHSFEIETYETTREKWLRNMPAVVPSALAQGASSACTEPTCPVGDVTWFEAVEYANRTSKSHVPSLAPCYALSGCTGRPGEGMVCTGVTVTAPNLYDCEGYRLATDAEFEYATRAGTTTAFYAGDIARYPDPFTCHPDPNLDRIAWFCTNSGSTTHPAGGKQANGWGLYDMVGNAAEYVNDRFTGVSELGPLTDPGGALQLTSLMIQRSCLPVLWAPACRSAQILNVDPGSRTAAFGLRLVRTLK
jgi:formylglycine-generating enzyme